MTTAELARYAWSEPALERAFERLAALSALRCPPLDLPQGTLALGGATLLARAAESAGLDLVPTSAGESLAGRYRSRPALWQLAPGSACGWLLVRARRGTKIQVEGPGGEVAWFPAHALSLQGAEERSLSGTEPAGLLDRLGVTDPATRELVERVVCTPAGERRPFGSGFELELPASAPLRDLARRHSFAGRLAWLLAVEVLSMAIYLGLWAWLGDRALSGSMLGQGIVAWGLLLAMLAPARLLAGWLAGRAALDASELLQRRLLAGALRLDLDRSRRHGSGGYIAQALEAERFESLALEAGLQTVLTAVEIGAVGLALSWAAAEPSLLLAVGAGFVATLAIAAAAHGRREAWATQRIATLASAIEKILGHRTRLVQESPSESRQDEDRRLSRLHDLGHALDRSVIAAEVWSTRAWSAISVGVAVALVHGAGDARRFALLLAVILLAERAMTSLGAALQTVSAARIAARNLATVLAPAGATAAPPALAVDELAPAAAPGDALLEARNLGMRFAADRRPVLAAVDLSLGSGERALLEGPSGSGKSTLLAILAGLRQADSGGRTLRGLDPTAYGERLWRRRVALVPQFHDNHLFAAPLAFNLLLGRAWPPAPDDFDEAFELCSELGLSGLIERMPLGLLQPVGEGGWRLSHGERGRVFVARALLQSADIVLLDESFAGLDPETAGVALAAAERRSRSLLVVAHS